MKEKSILTAAGGLFLGLSLCGLFVYFGIHELSTMNRTVTVKGLSEREVQADYVVWPMSLSVDGNDLVELSSQISKAQAMVIDFMTEKGIDATEISKGSITIDNNWQGYYDNRPEFHYTIHATLVISTPKVETVIALQDCQSELLSKGIMLNSYQWNIDYQFKAFTQLKLIMIEEATKNARVVAQQFADNSKSQLGGIRQANQGQFVIESDTNQPWKKNIRVVTTIDYYLK